jgi:NADP-dependent 3-hydroxy acid dehydrogenase YdfG
MPFISPEEMRGRVALVTGASGEIGRAIAVGLAGRGVRLYLVGRDPYRLEDTVQAVRGLPVGRDATVVGAVADLAEPERARELAHDAVRRLGGLDILVHSAGRYQRGRLDVANLDDLDELYRTNVRGPYELTQAALRPLARSRGDIVFVNSTQGLSAAAEVGGYAATQHATKAVSESLRAEVNASGVRVTTIHLGRTATPMQEAVFAAERRVYTPELLIHPDDVADVVAGAVALPKRAQMSSVTIVPTEFVARA